MKEWKYPEEDRSEETAEPEESKDAVEKEEEEKK